MAKRTTEAAIKVCVSVTHLWGNEVMQLLSGKHKGLWCTTHVYARAMHV